MTICDFAPRGHRCGAMCYTVEKLSSAIDDGLKWGNMVYALEMHTLSKMSEAEKAALEVKKAAAAEAEAKKLKDCMIKMKITQYASKGVADVKFNRMCKEERHDGGCGVHNNMRGACGFIHVDERDEYVGVFAGFGIKMLEDASYFAALRKKDAAEKEVKKLADELKPLEGDERRKKDDELARTRDELKACEEAKDTIDKVLKTIMERIWTVVDASGKITFSKINPKYNNNNRSWQTKKSNGWTQRK